MGFGRQDFQWNIAILLMLLAIVMAVFFILIFTYIQDRPLSPAAQQVLVEDQLITVSTDPAMAVRLTDTGDIFVEPQPLVVQEQEQVQEQEPEPTPEPEPQPEPTPQPPPPSPDSIIFIDYLVQLGDTLYRITHNRIDTNIALLARYNIAADNLVAGKVIRMPIGNPAYCPGYRPYAVHEGDTSFAIARRFNISLDQLRAINQLDANATIHVATIICVP
ncbi:MAG: LysM peptidoglycan-binding domain-containing protein [Chloroflexota bacterium]